MAARRNRRRLLADLERARRSPRRRSPRPRGREPRGEWGHRVDRLLLARDCTSAQLARELGLSARSIQNYILGERAPAAQHAHTIRALVWDALIDATVIALVARPGARGNTDADTVGGWRAIAVRWLLAAAAESDERATAVCHELARALDGLAPATSQVADSERRAASRALDALAECAGWASRYGATSGITVAPAAP